MRNFQIVNLRALAIILVVAGHSMIIYDPSWTTFITINKSVFFYHLKEFINTIQMPLFFSISGFLFYKSITKTKKDSLIPFIRNKFSRIIIPYLIVSLLWLIPIRLFVDYSGYHDKSIINIITSCILFCKDNGHLWFLPSLFFIFIIMYLFSPLQQKWNIKKKLILFAFLVLLTRLSSFVPNVFNLPLVLMFCMYFYIGIIIREFYETIKQLSNKFKTTIKFLLLFFAVFCISLFGFNLLKVTSIVNMFMAVSGIVLLYLAMPDKSNKVIEFIDKNSFGIYLFHSPIVYIFYCYFAFLSPVLLVSLNLIIGGGISIVITLLCRKCNLGFILGEKK